MIPVSLLACPVASCRGAVARAADADALVCKTCGARYPIEDGIPRLRAELGADDPSETVREFYTHAPFPGYPPRLSLSALRARAARSDFARLLDQAIPPDANVLEIGCGTGQLSLFLATADRVVVGADLTRASLALGAEAARRFGLDKVSFVESDLRAPGLRPASFDVVCTLGVLHHTADPRASFASVVKLLKPGGTLVLGLYNTIARFPHLVRRAVARLTHYKVIPFDPVLRDRHAEPARREAWLRDQYQHPEEHRHTLGEVQGWFREHGLEYVRAYPTSTIAEEPLTGDALFSYAEDNWAFERWMIQLGWMRSIAYEGGLFVTIGRASG